MIILIIKHLLKQKSKLYAAHAGFST